MPKSRILRGSAGVLVRCAAALIATTSLCQAPRQTSEIKKPLIYQIGQYLHINASGPRPLLQAVEAVQGKYGWVLDYEDPEYTTAPGGAASRPSPPHHLHSYAAGADAGDGFSLQFNVGADPNIPPDQQKFLTALVDAYNQSAGTAQFKLLKQQHNSFAIVGVAVQGANEQMIAQQPVLDLPITLVRASRNTADAIAAICHQVSRQSKLPISIHLAANASPSATAVIGGSAVPARELLSQALATMGDKAYWQLLYDGQNKSYDLDIKELSQ